jgi:hypothetical protein
MRDVEEMRTGRLSFFLPWITLDLLEKEKNENIKHEERIRGKE